MIVEVNAVVVTLLVMAQRKMFDKHSCRLDLEYSAALVALV